ncbi:hypothetical protein AVEN_54917-1 [Araneus ventricosus]|uniref:Uncharacterized protein n=1 Tax=Araneus ventricosus TaxID=182803 RepID=A0A4Y2T4I9_ARAVE|nr:hypothetical protein AVEN_54917-1 [Araneus ventricosus]
MFDRNSDDRTAFIAETPSPSYIPPSLAGGRRLQQVFWRNQVSRPGALRLRAKEPYPYAFSVAKQKDLASLNSQQNQETLISN